VSAAVTVAVGFTPELQAKEVKQKDVKQKTSSRTVKQNRRATT
jgi:hypothetical protein